jgi:hypothetical protein
MPRYPHHKRNKYSTPAKGTKSRALLLGMLSKRGLTASEALERGYLARRSAMAAMLSQFYNTGGWDIRGFTEPSGTPSSPFVRYRIVGRFRWEGGYRSFIED